METRFVKKIFSAMQNMNKYEHLDSFELACSTLIKDLASDLENLLEIFDRFNFEAISSIISLTDKKLEDKYRDLLDKTVKYVDGVDRIFNKRGVELAKLCVQKFQLHDALSSEEIEKRKKLSIEIAKQEKAFGIALKKVNKFSKELNEKAKNVKHLKKYEYQFNQLSLFETLDLNRAFDLLAEKGKIS